MSMRRTFDPFSEMLSLRDAMGQLLESSVVRPGAAYAGASQASYSFPINIHGTPDALKVEALLPGVSQEDVNVDLDRGVLTLSASTPRSRSTLTSSWLTPGRSASTFRASGVPWMLIGKE